MTVDEFRKILANGHLYQSLYHFTDRANLISIAKHGLLSKKEAARKGIAISVFGGNQWSHDADELKGLEDYVNLCFTHSHPMCYVATADGRITHPEYLPIDPDVLKIEGVKICLGVANKAGSTLVDVEAGLDALDVEVLYTRTDWNEPDVQQRLRQAERCEVLVPRLVPIGLIRRKFP